MVIEAKDKQDALSKAKKIMEDLNRYECFKLKDVHEVAKMQGKLAENKNKSFIYRTTDNVIDVLVAEKD